MKLKKLAIISSHPIQYNDPLFRLLQKRNNIKIKVFYTWSQSYQRPIYDPGFMKTIEWDIPLLEGYNYTFVKNTSKSPGSDHFLGIDNPTLNKEITDWEPNNLLIFGWAFKSHLKSLRHFHNKMPILFRGDSHLLAETFGIKKFVRRIFLKWVYRHVDYVLYVGTNNKNYFLKHGIKENKLFLAPHAIDNSRFIDVNNKHAVEASLWQKKLGIKEFEIVFMYAGKLEPKKNTELLIKAFNELKVKIGVHLIIVGNGPTEEESKSKYVSIPNLHFIDFQNQLQMPIVYNLCDVFVLPSMGPIETWGLSINEAMACGKAVLASSICGATVDLIKEGINGYSFITNDKTDLVTKMNKLAESKEKLQIMGKASSQIIQDFSYDIICTQIEKIVS